MKTTVGGTAASALPGPGAFAKPERSRKIIGIKKDVQVLVLCALCPFAVSLLLVYSSSSVPG